MDDFVTTDWEEEAASVPVAATISLMNSGAASQRSQAVDQLVSFLQRAASPCGRKMTSKKPGILSRRIPPQRKHSAIDSRPLFSSC